VTFVDGLVHATSLEHLVETLNVAGVDKAVLVQPEANGWDNRDVLDAAHAYPDRLTCVCAVDPLATDAADQLARLVEAHGCKGLQLRPRANPDVRWFDGADQNALWSRADKLGIPISVELLHDQMPSLEAMVRRFPAVRVVIDHLGLPDVTEGPHYPSYQRGLLRLASYPNTYVKITNLHEISKQPFPHVDTHRLIRFALRAYGPERMLWGSGFPSALDGPDYVAAFALAKSGFGAFDEEGLEWVLGRTATGLWW
jgi:predicted TIM-barrel fold metal-dependent hydrolase